MDMGIGSGHPGLGSGLPGLGSGLHDPGATTAAVTRVAGFHSVGLGLVRGGVDPCEEAEIHALRLRVLAVLGVVSMEGHGYSSPPPSVRRTTWASPCISTTNVARSGPRRQDWS